MSHCCNYQVGGDGRRGVFWVAFVGLNLALVSLMAAAENDARSVLYAQEPRPVDQIPGGLVIANGPPQGWSHLIVKNQPRLAPSEAKKVFPVVAKNAALLFSTILADVAEDQQQGGFFLRQLAVGFGTKVNGQDVTVTSASAKQIGANLGLVGGMILSQSEQRLGTFQLVARSPTIALLDIPAIMLIEDKHRDMFMRYAVLVDERTGKLDALLWLLDPSKSDGYQLASGVMRRLHPNLVEDGKMHVDPQEFTAGIPGQRAFAVYGAPPGQNATIPDRIMPLLERRTLDFDWLPQLERELRGLAFADAK